MVKLLLGLDAAPSPHDVADALAVAICHVHSAHGRDRRAAPAQPRHASAGPRERTRLRPTGPPQLWPARSAGSRPRDRPSHRHPGREIPEPPDRRCRRRRLRRAGARSRLSTALAMPGATVTLRVHTHVREDVIALYGFAHAARAGSVRAADRDQRHRAEAGARGPVRHRRRRAGARDPDPGRRPADARFPGIGKKTAERIGLELKDRLPLDAAVERSGSRRRRPAISAATICCRRCSTWAINVRPPRRRSTATLKKSPDASFEQLLRDVLRGMMGR